MKKIFYLISIFFLFITCQEVKKEKHLIENLRFQEQLMEFLSLTEDREVPIFENDILKAIAENDSLIMEDLKIVIENSKLSNLYDSIYYWLEIPIALENLDDSINSAIEFRYWRPYSAKHFISIIQSSEEHVWMESFFYELNGNPLTHPKTYNKTCMTIIEQDKRTLTEKEWNNFRTLFARSEFWQLRKYHNQNIFDPHGTDWDFRGYSKDSQPIHEVSVSSPPKGNNFRDIGEFMIEKSQIDIGRIF